MPSRYSRQITRELSRNIKAIARRRSALRILPGLSILDSIALAGPFVARHDSSKPANCWSSSGSAMAKLTEEKCHCLWSRESGRPPRANTAPQDWTIEVLNILVSAGLATKMVETRVRAAHAVETTHGWEITPAGRDLALRETMKPWAR